MAAQFYGRAAGARGILPESSSSSGSIQDTRTPCQCISGLASRSSGGSRFMKSAGRSQLPSPKLARTAVALSRAPATGLQADGHREPPA